MTQIKLVYNHLPQLSKEMRSAVGLVVKETGFAVERASKAAMTLPKHGRAYRRGAITKKLSLRSARGYKGAQAVYGGGRVNVTVGYKFHRASAPGEAPAVDTGNLMNSIRTRMVGALQAEVVAGAEYAQLLETRRNRPIFGAVVKVLRGWFEQRVKDALKGLH